MSVIHHTFGPHVDGAFLRRTLLLLLQPWRWRNGRSGDGLRTALHMLFDGDVMLFGSGREGLLALLRAMDLSPGDEVIVQGYTCIAIPNAVLAAGATPVYVDIDRATLNLDPEAVEAAVTPRTRMIIAQHTFGIPAPTQRLRELCDARGIFLLEDCAHVLPDQDGPEDIALYGDGLLLSFGRDKAVSGISGGAVVCRQEDIAKRLRREEEQAAPYGHFSVGRLLLYPLAYAVARLLWPLGLGKTFLKSLQLLHLMPQIYTADEKMGRMPKAVHSLPEACAALALASLRNLRAMNAHRRTLSALYLQASADHGWPVLHGMRTNLPLQKYPLFTENASHVRSALKKQDIYLDDGWTRCVVCPASVDPKHVGYAEGCDPHAEYASAAILTLPTHPTMRAAQAKRLIGTLAPLLSPAHDRH